jgi:hypothetical protein
MSGPNRWVVERQFRREMIQREISRVLVLNLSGNASGASALPRIFLSLTAPSLLSRRAPSYSGPVLRNKSVFYFAVEAATRLLIS